MSGFAGIVRAEGETPHPELLEKMADSLAFRGPDATQVWTSPGAGFCFTLLRTGPAPQAATQPVTLDGRMWLLGEVRLDGRQGLLNRLRQAGYKLEGESSDEELVLSAWQQWGETSFEQLSGDLSFAIWDAQARTLRCIRDLLGVRPFFYAFVGGVLVFSNTLNTIRVVPDISVRLDPYFIGDFLLQGWCSEPERTAFADIRRLPAGHLLQYRHGEVRVRRYKKLPIEEPLSFKRHREYLGQFRELFTQAVRERLPSSSAGIFMSGGLDSTSVAATAAQVQRKRGISNSLGAYTLDYAPLFEDQEGHFASLTAAHIGIPIEILKGASREPLAGWNELSLQTPEPCAEPFLALHVWHYQDVAEKARVVLTGDGGDDILTGRAWTHLRFLLRRGRFVSIAQTFGRYVLEHGRLPPLRAGIRARFLRMLSRVQQAVDYPEWLDAGFEQEFHLQERWRELQVPAKDEHPLHPGGYASLTSAFWPNIYENEDSGWTGVAVETRAPFFDQRLLRFLLRLPPVPWCMDKLLLREAMQDLLPDEVRLRRKTPLQGDPLQLHAEKNGWRPNLQNGYCETLHNFVNCSVLTTTSRPGLGLSLWKEIRPIALNLWLKAVENKNGIQYIRSGGH